MAFEKSNKNSNIRIELARYLLKTEIGENLLSVRDLAKIHMMSIGLISETLNQIEYAGAVRIERRGYRGSILVDKSIGKLWQIAENEPLVISQTLPSNRRYEGLATALKNTFLEAGIDTYFIFIRGSRTRIQALRDKKCHIAIVSQFAAEGLCQKKEKISLTLPPKSFVSDHLVFYNSKSLPASQNLTIAIDPDSYDQSELSKIEFNDMPNTVYKKVNFMNIALSLHQKEMDAAIWTKDDMEKGIGKDFVNRELSEKTQQISLGKDTQAALVIQSENLILDTLINKLIDVEEVIRIQDEVIQGKRIPEY
jgi:hypothetical protein